MISLSRKCASNWSSNCLSVRQLPALIPHNNGKFVSTFEEGVFSNIKPFFTESGRWTICRTCWTFTTSGPPFQLEVHTFQLTLLRNRTFPLIPPEPIRTARLIIHHETSTQHFGTSANFPITFKRTSTISFIIKPTFPVI